MSRDNARHATRLRSTLFIVDGNDNIDLEMWSYEAFGGTTFYLNQAKTLNLAAVAFYETHISKDDSSQKVGDPGMIATLRRLRS